LIRRGILFAQKFFAEIVDTRITKRVRVVLRQQGRFLEGNKMSELDYYASKLSNILTRMNEAEVFAEKVELSIVLASYYNEANKLFTHDQIVKALESAEAVTA